MLIKNFNKLCYNVTKKHRKKFFCMNCIQHFPSQERLDKHKPDCMKINQEQALEMPKEDTNFFQSDTKYSRCTICYLC